MRQHSGISTGSPVRSWTCCIDSNVTPQTPPSSDADSGNEETPSSWEKGYDREVIERIWKLAQVVSGNDPAVWRRDEFGAWIHRLEYRNRNSEFGWEIADCGFRSGVCGIATLRPMHWENHLDYLAGHQRRAVIRADGLRNARRLI